MARSAIQLSLASALIAGLTLAQPSGAQQVNAIVSPPIIDASLPHNLWTEEISAEVKKPKPSAKTRNCAKAQSAHKQAFIAGDSKGVRKAEKLWDRWCGKGYFPFGSLQSAVKKPQRLFLVPVISTSDGSEDEATQNLRKATRQVEVFWNTEVPGMKLSIEVTRSVNKSCADILKLSPPSPPPGLVKRIRPGDSLLFFNWQCSYGIIRYGYDGTKLFIGSTASATAYISSLFADNLGIPGAIVEHCRSQEDMSVPYSKDCSAFLDVSNATSARPSPWAEHYGIPSGVRVGAVSQCLLLSTTDCRKINPKRDTVITLSSYSKGAGLPKAAFVPTPNGPVFFDAAPYNWAGISGGGVSSQLGASISIANYRQSVTLDSPSPPGHDRSDLFRLGEQGLAMSPGTYWDIPGTALRVVVVSAAPGQVTLRFLPVAKAVNAPLPTAPVLTASRAGLSSDWELQWTGSSGDVAAYQVLVTPANGGPLIREVSPLGQSLLLESLNHDDDMTVVVRAVGSAGQWSESNIITLQ